VTMPEITSCVEPDEPRFVYLEGANGSPLPTAVRELIKGAPYRADWLPGEKRWRVTATAYENLEPALTADGWVIDARQPTRARRVGLRECAECGQPYRWSYSVEGACRSCGNELVLIPPPSAACGGDEGGLCAVCSEHWVHPRKDRFCPCGAKVHPSPQKSSSVPDQRLRRLVRAAASAWRLDQ
jgi:hypothetical protein